MTLTPLIPAWYDDLPLTAREFRVLSNLWRRSGKDRTCFPAAKRIATDCRIHRDTVWAVLKSLEDKRLLKRIRRTRSSNVYQLLVPDSGKEGPASIRDETENEGCQTAEGKGQRLAASEGWQLAGSKGCKGIPIQGIPTTEPKEGAPTPNCYAPLCLSDTDRAEIAKRHNITEEGVNHAVGRFNANGKQWFSKDGQKTIPDFYNWMAGKHGREIALAYKCDSNRHEGIPEPSGWKSYVQEKYNSDSPVHRDNWAEVAPFYQRLIADEMRAQNDAAQSPYNDT